MDLEEEREGRRHGGRVECGGKKNVRKRMRRLAGWICIRLSRATPHGATRSCHACGATQSCHGRLAGTCVPGWQLGRAEACGVTLQGVAPRDLARPKGLVIGNLDLDGL